MWVKVKNPCPSSKMRNGRSKKHERNLKMQFSPFSINFCCCYYCLSTGAAGFLFSLMCSFVFSVSFMFLSFFSNSMSCCVIHQFQQLVEYHALLCDSFTPKEDKKKTERKRNMVSRKKWEMKYWLKGKIENENEFGCQQLAIFLWFFIVN